MQKTMQDFKQTFDSNKCKNKPIIDSNNMHVGVNIVTPSENIYIPGEAPVREPRFERFGGQAPFANAKNNNNIIQEHFNNEEEKGFPFEPYSEFYYNPSQMGYPHKGIPIDKKDPMVWDPPSPKPAYKPKNMLKPKNDRNNKKPTKTNSQQ